MEYHIGKGVCLAQEDAGVSNEALAAELNVSRMQIHRYRTQEDMRFSTMCDIADYCELHILDFIKLCEKQKSPR